MLTSQVHQEINTHKCINLLFKQLKPLSRYRTLLWKVPSCLFLHQNYFDFLHSKLVLLILEFYINRVIWYILSWVKLLPLSILF